MVNPAFEKQSEREVNSTVGKTIKQIYPKTEQSWINKLASVVFDKKPTQFEDYNKITKKYYNLNAFFQTGNKFVMVVDDITRERTSMEELRLQNIVREKRSSELIVANKELVYQNNEKEKRAAELIAANKEVAFQNNEKEKRAMKLVIAKENAEQSDWLKSAFLANMSHEIRAPMNGILGFSELLKSPTLIGEQQQDYIRIIEKSGHRMLNTINDIISISKIESGLMDLNISESNINEQNVIDLLSIEPAFDSTKVLEKKLNILIVEDDETLYLLLRITLKEISEEILHAKNGKEAIKLCLSNPDIDLILMDIQMPLMDGHEASKKIRKFNKDVIIIAQAAHVFEGDNEKAIAAGCNEYLSKPFMIKDVMSIVQKHLKKNSIKINLKKNKV
ncbi:MAG: CheY-like chemotaxis protein [Parvicellaceae bacterium]|jgi:CheY-like chemotaxis protein